MGAYDYHPGSGPCPTCDAVEDHTGWPCRHRESHSVECGTCEARWCAACDPAPAALCHYCHGRGYSTCEIAEPLPVCGWYALCDNRATEAVDHPILGSVDICDRCLDLYERQH